MSYSLTNIFFYASKLKKMSLQFGCQTICLSVSARVCSPKWGPGPMETHLV